MGIMMMEPVINYVMDAITLAQLAVAQQQHAKLVVQVTIVQLMAVLVLVMHSIMIVVLQVAQPAITLVQLAHQHPIVILVIVIHIAQLIHQINVYVMMVITMDLIKYVVNVAIPV